MSKTVIAFKKDGGSYEFPETSLGMQKRMNGHLIERFEFKKEAEDEPATEIKPKKQK